MVFGYCIDCLMRLPRHGRGNLDILWLTDGSGWGSCNGIENTITGIGSFRAGVERQLGELRHTENSDSGAGVTVTSITPLYIHYGKAQCSYVCSYYGSFGFANAMP